MGSLDVCKVLLDMQRKERRNVRELSLLYTTDDLRRLYQESDNDLIRLRDGIISRVQLVAFIRYRIFWARFGYGLLLLVSIASAIFALLAWRDPVPAPTQPIIVAPAQPLNAQ
jgi:hypothetical protein